MTAVVLVLTLIGGTISTIYFFFKIGDLGWMPFLGTLVGTAIISLLIKIYDMANAALDNTLSTINGLNMILKQLHELQNKRE